MPDLTLHASPAADGGRAPARPGACGRCGATPARLYPQGRRCAACTPAALAGLPEPPPGQCPAKRHYCPPHDRCERWTPPTEETP